MTDITTRLRRWTHDAHAVPASDLMDEAAGEIDRLRSRLRLQDAVIRSGATLALTSQEQEAVEIAIGLDDSGPLAATLRGLLERTRVEPPDLTVSFRSSPHHRQHVAGSNTGQNSGV